MWELPVSLLLGALTAGGIILLFLARLVLRMHWRADSSNQSRMVGLTGKAVTEITSEGRVMVQGEYWWARARTRIAAGENVRVVGLEGMTLEVEPCLGKTLSPRPVSAIAPPEAEDQ